MFSQNQVEVTQWRLRATPPLLKFLLTPWPWTFDVKCNGGLALSRKRFVLGWSVVIFRNWGATSLCFSLYAKHLIAPYWLWYQSVLICYLCCSMGTVAHDCSNNETFTSCHQYLVVQFTSCLTGRSVLVHIQGVEPGHCSWVGVCERSSPAGEPIGRPVPGSCTVWLRLGLIYRNRDGPSCCTLGSLPEGAVQCSTYQAKQINAGQIR